MLPFGCVIIIDLAEAKGMGRTRELGHQAVGGQKAPIGSIWMIPSESPEFRIIRDRGLNP